MRLVLDRHVDRHYLTYGLGFDWEIHRCLAMEPIEAFGQSRRIRYPKRSPAAISDRRSLPPNEIFSVDVIYGRNIMGENANWITWHDHPFSCTGMVSRARA